MSKSLADYKCPHFTRRAFLSGGIDLNSSIFTKLDMNELDAVAGGNLSDEVMTRIKSLIEAAYKAGFTKRFEDVIATWEEFRSH